MEILQHVTKRMPSFRVVDISPVNSTPFDVDNEKLVQLIKTKNQDILKGFGGVQGITSALKSNASFGIRGDAQDLRHRSHVFGSNAFQKTGVSRFMYSILCSLKDFPVLMTLACVACLISAGIWLYMRQSGYAEGACCLAMFSVFFMLSLMVELGIGTYFTKVKKSGLLVVVIRNGLKQQIPFSGVLVGDIVCLKCDDKIPADGLLVDGDQSLNLDESHLIGIAEVVKIDHASPFLTAGAKVIQGPAKMVVTSVGNNTVFYEKEGSLYQQGVTELRARVHILARYLERAKWILAVSCLPISLARYFSGNSRDGDRRTALDVSYVIVESILAIVAISLAMDTTSFSWAVKVSLANAIDKMAAQKIVVRNLSAWEKIGLGAATIHVVDRNNTSRINHVQTSKFLFVPQFVGSKEMTSSISPNVIELVQQGIGLNTTGVAYRAVRTRKIEFSGSPAERAILSKAALELDMDWERLNQECKILKVEALEMEGRGVLVLKEDTVHLHTRGPADMILKVCSSFYDASGSLSFLNESMRNLLEEKIQSLNAGGTIRVIALAHKQVSEEELRSDQDLIGKEHHHSLLGFLALKETNQDQILDVVLEECINAGVRFNMITDENTVNRVAEFQVPESIQGLKGEISTEGTSGEDYKSVSLGRTLLGMLILDQENPGVNDKVQCHADQILASEDGDNGRVLEASHDANNATTDLTAEDEVTASSEEKILVSMCIEGEETTRRSDIVILDGNYSSLILILRWATCVLHNTQTFLQFQLTTSITTVLNTYLSTVTLPGTPGVDAGLMYVLVQIIWLNLGMGLIAAVTFGRQKPRPSKRLVEGRKWQLVTGFMWRNIIAQVVYQVLVISVLQFHGSATFGIRDEAKETVTFVLPMLLQAFNIINARKIGEKNIFSGIWPSFLLLVAILIAVSFVLVAILVHFVGFVRLDWKQWTICIGIAMVSWPVGFAVRFLPVRFSVSPLMAIVNKLKKLLNLEKLTTS